MEESNRKFDDKDHKESMTKNVLDYYKKFSQNKELSKYFSGASASFVPDHNTLTSLKRETDTYEKKSDNILEKNIEVVTSVENKKEEVIEEPTDVSRTSSVLSNRKLEWDNGADIGYINCSNIKRLHKSLSLPSIIQSNIDLEVKSSINSEQSSNENGNEQNIKFLVVNYASSVSSEDVDSSKKDVSPSMSTFEEKQNKQQYLSTNSDSSIKLHSTERSSLDSNSKRCLEFITTLTNLKQKIGLPEAHSTPKFLLGRKSDSVLFCKSSSKSLGNGLKEISKSVSDEYLPGINYKTNKKIDNVTLQNKTLRTKVSQTNKKYQYKKTVNLCVTKPLTVECLCDSGQTKRTSSRKQLVTIGIQTEEMDIGVNEIIPNATLNNNNQSLLYFIYADSSSTCRSNSVKTNEDVVSNCNSFEYVGINKDNVNNIKFVSLSKQSDDKKQDNAIRSLKRCWKKSDLNKLSSEESLKEASLLGDEIEKGVLLLQKLVKSKKYNNVSKKRYIKKIIKTIMESKNLEESSTSSEFFYPRKIKSDDDFVKTFTSSDSSSEILKNHLQSNVPWYPAKEKCPTHRKNKTLEIRTFTQNFFPEEESHVFKESSPDVMSSTPQEIIPVSKRDYAKKNRFTLSNNEFSDKTKLGSYDRNESANISPTFKENQVYSEEKHKISSGMDSLSSYQNWRDDKTTSEKLFEDGSRANGHGDCLVQFANKEREQQLNWINNEIFHLGKLKHLLEKTKQDKLHANAAHHQPTTSVYTVFNEVIGKDEQGANKREPNSNRMYCIENELCCRTSDEMQYLLENKKYTVKSSNSGSIKNVDKDPRIIGDIGVSSSDFITNIKITTFCDVCKRSPCVCCEKCQKKPCRCAESKYSNIALATDPESKVPTTSHCFDNNKKSIPGVFDYMLDKCVCGSQCTCNTQVSHTDSNQDYTGKFIPASLPSSSLNKHGRNFYSTFPPSKKDNAINTSSSHVQFQKPRSKDQKETVGSRDKSLKRMFENCECSTQTKCNCNFVENLLKHFNKFQYLDDLKAKEPSNVESKSKTVGVQVKYNCKHNASQTGGENKLIQTEKEKCSCQNIAVQTELDTKHQMLQTSQNLLDKSEYCNKSDAVKTKSNGDCKSNYEQHCKLQEANESSEKGFDTERLCTKETKKIINNKNAVNKKKEAKVPREEFIQKIDKNVDFTCKSSSQNTETELYCEELSYPNKGGSATMPTSSSTSAFEQCCCIQHSLYYLPKSRHKHLFLENSSSNNYKRPTEETATVEESLKSYGSSHNFTSEYLPDTSYTGSVTCVFCKQNGPLKKMSMIGKKTRDFLCKDCLKTCQRTCYKPVKGDIVNEIKATVNQLRNLESCRCTKSKVKFSKPDYCLHCKLKLNKTARSKNGIAYTLMVENQDPVKLKFRKNKRRQCLEEIRVKVPCSFQKKSKDRSNMMKKDSSAFTSEEINTTKSSPFTVKEDCRKQTYLSLQDYLTKNKPEFINSAENRRQTVLFSKCSREMSSENNKLKFLEENVDTNIKLKNPCKLFSEREMKEITKKNYRKLPEVQQKVDHFKKEKLRGADKLIANTLTKKIQESVLKGKRTFPIDTNVVNLPN